MDIVDPVRIAFFYDTGFVNAGAFNFSPYDYNDDFGFGIRLFVMGAPLHLDYASIHYACGRQHRFTRTKAAISSILALAPSFNSALVVVSICTQDS